jgi:hypothetical protein
MNVGNLTASSRLWHAYPLEDTESDLCARASIRPRASSSSNPDPLPPSPRRLCASDGRARGSRARPRLPPEGPRALEATFRPRDVTPLWSVKKPLVDPSIAPCYDRPKVRSCCVEGAPRQSRRIPRHDAAEGCYLGRRDPQLGTLVMEWGMPSLRSSSR